LDERIHCGGTLLREGKGDAINVKPVSGSPADRHSTVYMQSLPPRKFWPRRTTSGMSVIVRLCSPGSSTLLFREANILFEIQTPVALCTHCLSTTKTGF